MGRRSTFGQCRKLPSGRWQARYTRPGTTGFVNAPMTFDTRQDGQAWLATVRADMARGRWLPPDTTTTLADYAEGWLRDRTLKPRTRDLYRRQLDRLILPDLGPTRLRDLTPARVRAWHSSLGESTPTQRAQCYALLRTICGQAVSDEIIAANPCRIRGAGTVKRAGKTEPATVEELAAIADAMDPRYRLLVLLAGWCGLRFGELAELRRSDVDVAAGMIHVRRAVVVAAGKTVVGPPKSAAGVRDVAVPPHILADVKAHLRAMPAGRDPLLFPAPADPAKHVAHAELYRRFVAARKAAGRDDLRLHDLRHSGAVLAAQAGATLAELMSRLGHSTPAMAIRYQHVAAGRDAEIARRLSEMAERQQR